VTGSAKSRAKKAASLQTLFEATDKHNFFVVVPIASKLYNDTTGTKTSARILNGTRITLAVTGADTGAIGETLFDFSICSASTPERFQQYEEEIHAVFERLVAALVRAHQEKSRRGDADAPIDAEILTAAMDLFYFWVNFAPISRGTSATGYACLYAVMLAAGYEHTEASRVPPMTQLDWEAILATNSNTFADRVKHFLSKFAPVKSLPRDTIWLFSDSHHSNKDAIANEHDVSKVFTTAAEIIEALASVEHSIDVTEQAFDDNEED
jgi:hypothetical protein